MEWIRDVVKNIRVGEPASYRNLTVFPLFGIDLKGTDYLTLDEALERKCSEVTEVSEGGSVPELKFVNSGSQPVFLLDGEQLIGAKQNRVLNLSILVAGGKVVIIPVSCVEAGRWRHTSAGFSSSESAYFAEGRARKMAQVSNSLHSAGRRDSDQVRVWRDIAEKSSRFGVFSDTSAVRDIYNHAKAGLEDYSRCFSSLAGQSGALFAINGKIVGLDLFDSSETLKKLFPKLLHGYGLDAIDRGAGDRPGEEAACTPQDVAAFLESIVEAGKEEFDAVGEGKDVRLSGKNLTGAALVVDDRVVHLGAFAVE
ncbi:MAG: hypothetical protein JW793_07830 [Acidobacteria bacterium]|nr:hypothetical protein [Acidobacteriota bacterium]